MRQARKSLAHVPSTDVSGDNENSTVDSAALSNLTTQIKEISKKSRSKSLGPGGLNALKESTGNKQEVWIPEPKLDQCSIIVACSTTTLQIYSEAHDTVVSSEDHSTSQCRWQSFSN